MSEQPFTVTAADPRSPDAAALIRALSAELAARYDFADDGSGKFRPEDVDGPGSGFLVGWLDGRAVACGAFRPLDGPACEIKRMFVAEEVRGRGLAGLLLAEIERLAREAGYAVARLETGARQPESIRLYERAGYHRIENFGGYHGNEQSLCFEKALAAG